ncbi:hypothetical protein M2459_001966 [Parabacteroides sp. PF5-5]|uniref:DUF7281 domain-containing protein n=1 Tax=unclassified Parabacteroides TaxID=2649774 RepID=UPI0024761CFE|nr:MULTISPECIES: hypothetical protein [unclassified Parabacteroides]MDH6306732.1 hypothetical protein [Parabacteroides sp. PH5-39]MDH6316223.1 hypothetical protein [Parabacteroides sp. PF5-13]MDH6321416.1 hypothetical protein [Parabacteroides sp. PH5-13]MDH6325147.1 hypothetical protein [Parabacteroides sp. PH5-8]MDH6327414.1 hypothetical protein [Parabacteroides sp. PH5-41]
MLRLGLAKKLLRLLEGEKMPSSQMKYPEVKELLAENILTEIRQGRMKSVYQLRNPQSFYTYLSNRFGIHDLYVYVDALKKEEITKSELVLASSDSKARTVRSFKGFLVNSYEPISATLNNEQIVIHPASGTFQFIYDFETFTIDKGVTVVGVENAENFRQIEKQHYLFEHIKPLFVSRYPQNQYKDLIRWLQIIDNPYLHFGDFDLAGIRIFLFEYFQHLGDKAHFFIPPNIESLIEKYGNSKRYNNQITHFDTKEITNEKLLELVRIIHSYKKGLDQEALIR